MEWARRVEIGISWTLISAVLPSRFAYKSPIQTPFGEAAYSGMNAHKFQESLSPHFAPPDTAMA
jgi:hypothetical protein